MSNQQQPEALRLADACDAVPETGADPEMIEQSAAELRRLHCENEELKEAARINLENYEFQRRKADRATAAVYQFHYAMKDAGWHPGRTDDDLTDIIRKKGKELNEVSDQRDELLESLRMNAQSLAWLAHGKCRGFHPGLPAADESLDAARAAIAKVEGGAA